MSIRVLGFGLALGFSLAGAGGAGATDLPNSMLPKVRVHHVHHRVLHIRKAVLTPDERARMVVTRNATCWPGGGTWGWAYIFGRYPNYANASCFDYDAYVATAPYSYQPEAFVRVRYGENGRHDFRPPPDFVPLREPARASVYVTRLHAARVHVRRAAVVAKY